MRGLYPNSTDLAYSPFPKEDLLEVARAIGASNINVITTATLKPERTLFHSCLNGVQSFVRLHQFGETERGQEISELSDRVYGSVKDAFEQALEASQDEMQQKCRELHDFVAAIETSQAGKAWDEDAFAKQWPRAKQSHRWQSKAIETYQTVKNNIESGEYHPSDGWDAKHVAEYWGARNLEYKHYRWIGRELVEDYINEHFADRLLTKHPSEERAMCYIFGPMGAGKTNMTAAYLWQRPESERTDVILHDADYLKAALAASAIQDGIIEESTGAEVQNESSIALYEGTRKRHFLASRRQNAPDVVINSIAANSLELEEGLVGGGSIAATLISMSPEDAWQSVTKRGESLSRLPAQEDVAWSTRASVDSLLTIAALGEANVKTDIYDRAFGKCAEKIATLDNQIMTLQSSDAKRLKAVFDRSPQGFAGFVRMMQSHGVNFEFRNKADGVLTATLSADGVWKQSGLLGFSDGLDAFKTLANRQLVGDRQFSIQQWER